MVAVVKYSLNRLTRLFQEFCDDGSADKAEPAATKPPNLHVGAKHHIEYINDYMTDRSAETIVVEEDYIDRDFLEDFAAYHVRSFYPYRRRCARLHFFDKSFDKAALLEAIEASPTATLTPKVLQGAYIGFVVIKPLPSTVVGRTCFKPYPDDKNALRLYPATCIEKVDLFGIRLTVDTLPFQEQDRDVAACASSALWSVFHATGRLFQHPFPSPVQITAAATQRIGQDERVLPNGNGLTGRQMADAIRSVQLEPYVFNCVPRPDKGQAEDESVNLGLSLRIALAAYVRAGIPAILSTDIFELVDGKEQFRGKHAVAVAGYRLENIDPVPYGTKGALFAATRITKLYVHDDQVGPFARMEFRPDGSIMTSQVNAKRLRKKIVARPRTLLVPLYHKIRIPFDRIMKIAIEVDEHLKIVRSMCATPGLPEQIVWDLSLVTLEDYRAMIRKSALGVNAKRRILTSFMPRFLWRLNASDIAGKELFDLLFDPTDLLQGRLFIDAVSFDDAASTQLIVAMASVDPKVWPELPLSTMRAKLLKFVPDPIAAA